MVDSSDKKWQVSLFQSFGALKRRSELVKLVLECVWRLVFDDVVAC